MSGAMRSWMAGGLLLAAACRGGPVPLSHLTVDPEPAVIVPAADGSPGSATVHLANTGDADVQITALALTGDEAARLRAVPAFDLPATLQPGDVLDVTVVLDSIEGLDASAFEYEVMLDVDAEGSWQVAGGCQGIDTEVVELDTAVPIIFQPLGGQACDGDLDGVAGPQCGGADCDDTSATVAPGLEELCDGLDNDCNELVDDGITDAPVWYGDSDGDGYGADDQAIESCVPVAGYTSQPGDCDDGDIFVHPGGVEICNDRDDDCDGSIDEDATSVTWYADADDDGYGSDLAPTIQSCTPPPGYSQASGDCDDTNRDVSPSGLEVCDSIDNNCSGTIDVDAVDAATWYLDADGDDFGTPDESIAGCEAAPGYVASPTDCDDSDASIHPAADEACDGIDNNCDGDVDGGLNQPWYQDGDGDGFGDGGVVVQDCVQPPGFVGTNTDCDDANSSVNPAASEVCNGIDDDCDAVVDPPTSVDAARWYLDDDGDTFGGPDDVVASCDPQIGRITDGSDCDDTDPDVNPLANELCGDGVDNDCDGGIDDEGTFFADDDGDGFGTASIILQLPSCAPQPGWSFNADDCDDGAPDINPSANELCDGVDNDCDGEVDEDSAGDATVWFTDADLDGFGDPAGPTVVQCTQPPGFVDNADDCDDGASGSFPGAPEFCDAADNDCNGLVDDNPLDPTTFFADADGDDFGDAAVTQEACSPSAGFVTDDTDCDDGSPLVFPGAPERCNGIDDDCNALIDDGAVDGQNWFADNDGDTFGDPATLVVACAQPGPQFVNNESDCDDANFLVNPLAPEVCNGVDDNCNTLVDDNPIDGATFFGDGDGDTFGDAGVTTQACSQPPGFVGDGTDCDDADASTFPGAPELCDGADNDCNGVIDDAAIDPLDWFADNDGDTFGDPSVTQAACQQPSGFVADNTDCDDGNGAINPGAAEVCDGVDNDCSGAIDDNAIDAGDWFADGDGDTFGNPLDLVTACTQPPGRVADGSDCDDTNAAVNPLATEVCDGADNDCDGTIDIGAVDGDPYFVDGDIDGFGDPLNTVVACSQPPGTSLDNTDCDDTNDTVFPGAPELCDGLDNDCNGPIDDNPVNPPDWFRDFDGDNFGTGLDVLAQCDQPPGYVDNDTDCNDANPLINPGQPELCNGQDDDCNFIVDDNPIDGSDFFRDFDGDGFGDPADSQSGCNQPPGYVTTNTDCEDTVFQINPSVFDVCDAIDNDCSGLVDDAGDCESALPGFCEMTWDLNQPDNAYLYCEFPPFTPFPGDWSTANTACDFITGGTYDLLTIEDDAENQFIYDNIVQPFGGLWWMGYTDQVIEGVWLWVDGTPPGYENWGPGEPNDAGGEDCGELGRFAEQWNDMPCSAELDGFICEAI